MKEPVYCKEHDEEWFEMGDWNWTESQCSDGSMAALDAEFHIRSPYITGLEDMIIGDLRNEDHLSWNPAIIRRLFAKEEPDLILNIPLNLNWREKKCIWALIEYGKYTVKSGY